MNPFDLTGPEFIIFYLILSVTVLLCFALYRNFRESVQSGEFPKLNDPYKIAFLRGGKNEVIRVAIVSLIDRKFLAVAADNTVHTDKKTAVKFLKDPLEAALIAFLSKSRKVAELYSSSSFSNVMKSYESDLSIHELLPSPQQRQARTDWFYWSLAVLAGTGITKLIVGLSRNKPVIFLILLMILDFIALVVLYNKRRTSKGDSVLEDLKVLLGGSVRPCTSGQGNDLGMIAAVFGIAAVPAELFPERSRLFPKATASSNSSCGSSCGSGSSSGSSCSSSSCGGGGGCGGCGGGGD